VPLLPFISLSLDPTIDTKPLSPRSTPTGGNDCRRHRFAKSTTCAMRDPVQPIRYTQVTQQPNCDIFATFMMQFKR
jgi:hypothetical protein